MDGSTHFISEFAANSTSLRNTLRVGFPIGNHFRPHDPPARYRRPFEPPAMMHQAIHVRGVAGHFKLVALTAALLVLSATRPTDGTRILRANADAAADAVYSVWDPNDICSLPVRQSTDNQHHNVTCAGCLERPGCAIESTTGKCVSASRINTTVNAEYLLAGQNQYCEDIDNASSLCSADNAASAAVCRGVKGCVSVHQCEIAEAITVPPSSSQNSFRVYYLIIGGALLTTALIMMRLYRALSSEVMSTFDVRMHTRAAHAAKPLTMKLDGWRGFIAKERQDQTEPIEVKLCPTRASENAAETVANDAQIAAYEAQRNHIDATAIESDEESKVDEQEYVAVTTPRSISGGDNVDGGERGLRL